MKQEIEKLIYAAMRQNEVGSGVGSSVTANQILESIKPFYQDGTEEDKQAILERLNSLKLQPGIPIPLNVKELLSK